MYFRGGSKTPKMAHCGELAENGHFHRNEANCWLPLDCKSSSF